MLMPKSLLDFSDESTLWKTWGRDLCIVLTAKFVQEMLHSTSEDTWYT